MEEEEERRPAGGGNMRYERCGKGFSEFQGVNGKEKQQKKNPESQNAKKYFSICPLCSDVHKKYYNPFACTERC